MWPVVPAVGDEIMHWDGPYIVKRRRWFMLPDRAADGGADYQAVTLEIEKVAG